MATVSASSGTGRVATSAHGEVDDRREAERQAELLGDGEAADRVEVAAHQLAHAPPGLPARAGDQADHLRRDLPAGGQHEGPGGDERGVGPAPPPEGGVQVVDHDLVHAGPLLQVVQVGADVRLRHVGGHLADEPSVRRLQGPRRRQPGVDPLEPAAPRLGVEPHEDRPRGGALRHG
jgi:hypothetical protein